MKKSKSFIASASLIALVTLVSKLLGFFREVLIADRFGAGWEADTYLAASTATSLIIGMIAAAFNTVLIPVFSEIDNLYGKKTSRKFLNNVLNTTFFLSIILMVIFWFLSPLVMKVLASGFKGEQYRLSIELNRIGLPIIMGMTFTYIFSGFLQSRERFFAPAATGFSFNIVQIAFLIFLTATYGVKGLMVAAVISIFGQVLIQIPSAVKEGYKYEWFINLKDKYLRKTFILALPVVLGTAIQQINVIIDRTLASRLQEGSIAALNYATRINEIVIGIFATAISTAIFPKIAKAAANGNTKEIIKNTFNGTNLIFFITLPATLGLMILSEPIVKIFFERGAFDSRATLMTHQALFFFSIGMVGSATRLMLTRVYYSINDTRTPTINGVMAIVLNLILNLLLIGKMKHMGLALGTSIAGLFTTMLLLTGLNKKIDEFDIKKFIRSFFRFLIASIMMGIVIYIAYGYLENTILEGSKMFQMISLIGIVILGFIVYIIMLAILPKNQKKINDKRR